MADRIWGLILAAGEPCKQRPGKNRAGYDVFWKETRGGYIDQNHLRAIRRKSKDIGWENVASNSGKDDAMGWWERGEGEKNKDEGGEGKADKEARCWGSHGPTQAKH